MGVVDILGKRVALDTAIFIYFIEEHPQYLAVVEPVFVAIDSRKLRAVTSALTLLEVLVVPYRIGNTGLAERYERILTRSRGLHFAELTRPLLRTAAQIRARFGVRTPDAIQLAAAVANRCETFLTNDRDLAAFAGIRVIQLSDLRAEIG